MAPNIEGDNFSKNITGANHVDSYYITNWRKASIEDTNKMNSKFMPGFTLSWKYDRKLDQDAKYSKKSLTKEFVR